MVLLAVLIVLALVGFFWRFDRVLRNIFSARKDPDFHIAPVGKRIWDFFWEVICQAKVIKERPLPGLAHAFVFWGFLAFALVSLNHFGSGFRLGFLDADGWVGGFYFWFAAVFALLVAVGIAGLFVRRFFVRPIWLGRKVSYESGVIAFLIFALMVTYLAAFFVPSTSGAARGLWWAHAFCILIFLPLIPHTKHLHLVLSPITIFLSRGEFSHIPPLNGDEDFGLVAGKDITQLVALQAYSCVECGRCTEHCPATNTGKILNPKEIILGVRSYLNDLGPHSEEPLLGKYNSQEAAFQCTTCGACEYQCPVGIEHLPIIIGLRRGAVNTGTMGRRSRHQALPRARAQRQRAGHEHRRARQIHQEAGTAHLRRLAGILPVARLHGRLRSAGPRDHRLFRKSDGIIWARALAFSKRRSAPAILSAASATTSSSSSSPSRTSKS